MRCVANPCRATSITSSTEAGRNSVKQKDSGYGSAVGITDGCMTLTKDIASGTDGEQNAKRFTNRCMTERSGCDMPTRAINRNMIEIDPDAIRHELRLCGCSVWQMAHYLLPQYAEKRDAYKAFNYWMDRGRMPKEKYAEMRRILDGTV